MTLSIALVGDSMRIHYQPFVAASLAESARVWGPSVNCESSRHLRTNLDAWVLNLLEEPTIVHVNAGGHDIRRISDDDWEVQVPIEEYRKNMEAIFDRLMSHSRVEGVIAATTTPVNEGRHQEARYSNRRNADVESYNQVLVDVAAIREITVNDLWAAITHCPFDPISSDGVHLSRKGQEYLGYHVAEKLKLVTNIA